MMDSVNHEAYRKPATNAMNIFMKSIWNPVDGWQVWNVENSQTDDWVEVQVSI